MNTREDLNNAFRLGQQLAMAEVAYSLILTQSDVLTNAPSLLTVDQCKAALIASRWLNLVHVADLVNQAVAGLWAAVSSPVADRNPDYNEKRNVIRKNQPTENLEQLDTLGAKLEAMRAAVEELRLAR
jgi:hypothetical protein